MTLTSDRFGESSTEVSLARNFGVAISEFVNGDPTVNIALTRANGEQLEAVVPAGVLTILSDLLTELAVGRSVTLVDNDSELTTHQAAN